MCARIVEEKGLENQGIYRVPGNSGAINAMLDDLNKVSALVSSDHVTRIYKDHTQTSVCCTFTDTVDLSKICKAGDTRDFFCRLALQSHQL